MLKSPLKSLLVLACALLLSACNETYSLQYLLEHPEKLEEQLALCLSEKPKLDPKSAACLQAKQAQKKFLDYLRAREREPGRYGQYILTSETTCSQLLIAISNAKQFLTELQQKNARSDQVQSAKIKLDNLQREYNELSQEVAFMLAVIGSQSP